MKPRRHQSWWEKAILGIPNAVTHQDQDKEDIERGLIQKYINTLRSFDPEIENASVQEADYFTIAGLADPQLYQDGQADVSEPMKVVE